MHRSNLSLITVLAACSLTVGCQKVGAESEAVSIVFSAKPTKKQFEVGERIVFSFSIRNNGQQDVAVPGVFVFGYDTYLKITGGDGSTVQQCGLVPKLLVNKLAILHPGEVRRASRNIRCEKERSAGYSVNEIGKYTVVAEYHTPGDREYWKPILGEATLARGPFKARPVEFWLVPKNAAKGKPD